MHSFVGDDAFFTRQIVWIIVGLIVFFGASLVDWRFLRRTNVLVVLYIVSAGTIGTLVSFGDKDLLEQ